ncbi:hypothetical protein QMA77_19550 [Pantoea ananatis]|uniref:hypothetical protein n=1 Tax=Pantoea ananas TaxID=553 RepID=UPI0024AD5756|nr:hypothetical protein [Pantoea ananatis]MDI6539121.1 hypothetical protein [Pantoea ananatis]
MNSIRFPFEHVLVMDPTDLTGLALCYLANEMAGDAISELHLSPLSLAGRLEALTGTNVLLITRLQIDERGPDGGLELVKSNAQNPGCRVMVCTGFTDPLLLRQVIKLGPAVVVMCQEPLDVLRQALAMAGVASPHTVLSPAVTEGLALTRDLRQSKTDSQAGETSLLMNDLREAARTMHISPRAITAWKRRTSSAGGDIKVFSWIEGAESKRK